MSNVSVLQNLLFDDPGLFTYAILDGASIPDLLDQIDSLQPEHVCLYRGELDGGIAEVAPYLVQLEQGHLFTRWLLDNGWGAHYGVFVHSPESLHIVRLHLRRSLRVYTEDGKAVLFRYYDPRVLRIFLPTMNPEEAKAFYGPVRSFLSEAEDPKQILRFVHRGSSVVGESFALGSADGWQRVSA